MPVLVSVIIPVYRDWERLALCLGALERQTLSPERFEIIVANNDPGTACPIETLPGNARLIDVARPGSYAARNSAVAISSGPFLAFTDSDCLPEPRWLEAGLEALNANPEARITGPVPVFREARAHYFAYLYDFHTAFNQLWTVAQGRCVTANLLVARKVFEKVGPFNEDLLSGGDSEWGTRAHLAGIPILYEESVCVRHPARRTVADILRKRRRIAGSDAVRIDHPTYRYVLSRLLPPVQTYSSILARNRAPVGARDRVGLFLIHWVGRLGEALEFLLVRLGLKRPNRT